MMKIVIPDKINLTTEARDIICRKYKAEIFDDLPKESFTITERIKNAEIITANYIDITRDIIKKCPSLKYIISPAVGYDWIDIDVSNEQGIKIINCPMFNAYSVAEHAIGLIFAVCRKIVFSQKSITEGEWNPSNYIGYELRGKNLLSIGYGKIGKSIVSLAKAIGMKVQYANSKTKDSELYQMIKKADVVVLCYPLNEKTKGSFNAKKISLLKQNAILINVARGLILDQDFLYDTLKNKKIFGAGLDVFNKDETLTEAREDIVNLARLDNVVATPHIGYNTYESKQRLGKELIENLDAIIAGKPINIVN